MKSAVDQRIRAFFDAYAAASLTGDAETVGAAYFSTYIEAAPSTVEAFNVDAEYRRAVEAKAKAMSGLGLVDSAIRVVGTTPLAPNHLLVEAEWRLRFDPKGGKPAETTFQISYVVRLQGDDPKILLALSHEDEERALQELGLA